MRIEDARDDDLPAILAIYNDVMRTSTAIYREEPATLEERQAWNETRKKNGYPLLVARTDDAPVAGFATFGDFRAWPGYRFTVEHSVHVADGRRGQGIGTALMQVLIERGSALGKHVMVAGIDADNGGLDPDARAPRLRADRPSEGSGVEVRALAGSGVHAAAALRPPTGRPRP